MTASTTRADWVLRELDAARVREVVRKYGVSQVAASLVVARDHDRRGSIEAHLSPRLTDLGDPGLLPDMEAACRRVLDAIEREETILVHGDYDVDGVTGTAILMRLFRHLGADARWHIPNRLTDGYSFGPHSVAKARETGARLVISVDNGTSARETIAELAALGIDTIVTDHHEPPQGALPDACALVNPKLPDSSYPFRELCGGAVAFKLAWGICQAVTGESRVRDDLRRFLVDAMGYVAIATVCDVVPLIDENRCLAKYGLRALQNTEDAGARALLRSAELLGRPLVADDVGYQIGPRLNASGRLGSAQTAVELLLCDDEERAAELARRLDELNQERRTIEREVLAQAEEELAQGPPPAERPALVVAGQGWHQGVVGIVAARLVDRYHKPTLVIGLDGDEGRGSARSIAGVSVLETMHAASDHFLRYGGHAQAAGCEVRAENVDAVREAMEQRAAELLESQCEERPPRVADCEVPFAQMTPDLMHELDRLGPYGQDNEEPLLTSTRVRLAEPPRRVGKERDHLMVRLRLGDHALRAMAFGSGHREPELEMGVDLDVLYTPRWNTFRGETRLELTLTDFRRSPA